MRTIPYSKRQPKNHLRTYMEVVRVIDIVEYWLIRQIWYSEMPVVHSRLVILLAFFSITKKQIMNI